MKEHLNGMIQLSLSLIKENKCDYNNVKFFKIDVQFE